MICFALLCLTILLNEASARPPGNGLPFLDRLAVLRMCRRQLSTGLPKCRLMHKRWYYDSRSQTCKPFEWTGCGGNDNRFESHHECENRCQGVTPCDPSLPHPPPDGCEILRVSNITNGCPEYILDCQNRPRTGSCPPATDYGPLPQDCTIIMIRTPAGCPKDIVTCA